MKKIAYLVIACTISLTSAFAQTRTTNTQTVEQTEQEKTSITLKISGINCGNDLRTLSERLNSFEGVYNCETVGKRGAKTKFKVDYNPSVITEKDIRKAFESTPGCSDPNDLPYKVK